MTDVEMVVNLHVTERCNYRCTYCFGKWGLLEDSNTETSVWTDTAAAYRIMWDLAAKFREYRGSNSPIRFNFVGGEPGLLPNIADLVEFTRSALGARASYVTNGLMLQRFSADWTAENIAVVGISVDSPLPRTNLEIGRATRSGKIFDLGIVSAQVRDVRRAADHMTTRPPVVKVNTVVSDLNVDEDFDTVLSAIRPDRWKILKMLPVYSAKTAISDEDFRRFARRHRKFVRKHAGLDPVVIMTEDNDQMTGSYAMVDPLARFFWYDEVPEGGYRYSLPMTEISVEEAWNTVPWDEQKFAARYTKLMDEPDETATDETLAESDPAPTTRALMPHSV